MSTADSHLKALLALSGNDQLAGTRRHLIRCIGDDDLLDILKKGVGREFARGGLEDIVSVLLDVIARDPASVECSDTTESPAASFKDEDTRGNTAQQQIEKTREYSVQQQPESMVNSATPETNDHSTSGQTATGMLTRKRGPLYSPSIEIRKRSRPNEPIIVAKPGFPPVPTVNALTDLPADPSAHSPQKVTLDACYGDQRIDNKTIPGIDIVGWCVDSAKYEHIDITGSFTAKFDRDYLSTDSHISKWGQLLRLRYKRVDEKRCVNDTVIFKTRQPGPRTGSMHEACDRCIGMKRLCARLVNCTRLQIALAFFPLPEKFRGDAEATSLHYWVRP